MTWFRNLSIGKRLAIAFGILEVLTIGLGMFSLDQLSRVNRMTVEVVGRSMPAVKALGNLQHDTAAIRQDELSFLLAVDHKDKWEAAMKQSLADLQQDEKQYQPLIATAEERKLYGAFNEACDKYLKVHADVLKLTKTNEYQAGVLAQGVEADLFEAAAKLLQEDVNLNDKYAKDAGSGASSVYSASRYWIIGLSGFAVIAGFSLAISIARSIAGASAIMLAQIQRIVANDLAVDNVEVFSHDEIGRASLALNTMKDNLRKVIQVIAGSAQQLANASEQINAGAAQAAEGARTQADQTHQVATAMQEMAATVQQVSENSQQASQMSQESADAAVEGGKVAEQTLATMHKISDSTKKAAARIIELGKRSEEIGRIVAVIDDIADQTNLLALNAAIEAARAGEQGRGFAVVADEVRKLAERTTKATKEIATMIEAIQVETKSAVQAMELSGSEVQLGVERTQASGEALGKIIKMSEQVGHMIAQIATAANQQSGATDEINGSINRINILTQQSSTSAEQSAKACSELSGLALDLQNLVSQFKVTTVSGNTAPRMGSSDPTLPLVNDGHSAKLQHEPKAMAEAVAAGAGTSR